MSGFRSPRAPLADVRRTPDGGRNVPLGRGHDRPGRGRIDGCALGTIRDSADAVMTLLDRKKDKK